jgi:cytoskeletal protein CcmA (bactofilin family)
VLTVDTDAQLRGRLVAAGKIVVNVWFEGDLVASKIVIGPGGYLTGSAAAREIIVEGQVAGPIHACTVILKGGCIVEGDIHHTTITIEPGATLTGRSSRFPAIQLPAELLQLEAQAADDRAAIEQAEQRSFVPDPVPLKASSKPVPPKPPNNILPLRRNP